MIVFVMRVIVSLAIIAFVMIVRFRGLRDRVAGILDDRALHPITMTASPRVAMTGTAPA